MPRITHPPPTIASAGARGAPSTPAIAIGEEAFVDDARMERWIRSGAVTRTGSLLTTADGHRYLLRDGLRILGRRNGESDPYGLTGRIETLRALLSQGATVSAHAVRLGAAVYDVEQGYLATAYESGSSVRVRRSAAKL